MVLLFGPRGRIPRLTEKVSAQVMTCIVGRRLAQLHDQILFFDRVIVRTARGYLVEANPRYTRDVIALYGLEDSKPVSTPSVKTTPTKNSLVELENERRATHRTVVGKL